eukprot:TRINITY_DN3506_c0_g1_i1.p1 TRINITY_DN3506_c0_g1~~TRINITY_DN3506_c0_g1_i1.p1  ORF type:complete len:480 (+),score=105.97 TRINITY_DN3506_c0_g1_i1:1612-3051(+)
MSSNKKVSYYYDNNVGNYYYGQYHPMRPHRMRMAHNLVVNYGLHKKMQIFRPRQVTEADLSKFHSDDYIDFLRLVTPDNMTDYAKQLVRFNVGEDCPVFDGMYRFCQASAGGSLGGAIRLNRGDADIAINWSGGLHHAKKSEASGFCYINDAVLAILELLKVHQRVLYIDIDVHHGDGVEEAFYSTDRVMTLSLHQFGEFFPGTGDIADVGAGKGKYHALNVPLSTGIDDTSYLSIFKPVMQSIMETYQPGAVLLQCGADSLSGDKLGGFNLSSDGHAACVEYVMSFNTPLLVVGGGGYTIRNVARCWANETAVLLDVKLDDQLPYNEYIEYYGPEYRLHVPHSNVENLNTKSYLEKCKNRILENIRRIGKPNAAQHEVPPSNPVSEDEDEEFQDADSRRNQVQIDNRVQRRDEYSDSEDEDNRRNIDVENNGQPPVQNVKEESKNGNMMEVDGTASNASVLPEDTERDNPSNYDASKQ